MENKNTQPEKESNTNQVVSHNDNNAPTEESLKLKKLNLEIEELSRPYWQKPAYLTIIVSAITVIASVFIAFGQYYYQYSQKVNQQNVKEIEDLRKKIGEQKEQQHNLELAKADYELLKAKYENKELNNSNSNLKEEIKLEELKLEEVKKKVRLQKEKYSKLKSEFNEFKNAVRATIEKYNKYSPNYARGVLRSPSGQKKIEQIVNIENKNTQKKEIESFAFGIMAQTNRQSTQKITDELNLNK